MIKKIFNAVNTRTYFECYFEGAGVIVSSMSWFEKRIQKIICPTAYIEGGMHFVLIPYDMPFGKSGIDSEEQLEAIIYHELGHLRGEFPLQSSTDLVEQIKYELAADRYMIEKARNPAAVISYLDKWSEAVNAIGADQSMMDTINKEYSERRKQILGE